MTITENMERPSSVNVNAIRKPKGNLMSDVTYKALFTGIVIGLTFSLVTYIMGYYVSVLK